MGTCSTWSLSQPLGTWAPSQVMGAASDCRKQVAQRGTPGAYYGHSCSSLGQEQLAEARGPPPGRAPRSSPTWTLLSLELSSLEKERHSLHLCGESFLQSQSQQPGPPALGSLWGTPLPLARVQVLGRLEVPQGPIQDSSKLASSIYNCFIK